MRINVLLIIVLLIIAAIFALAACGKTEPFGSGTAPVAVVNTPAVPDTPIVSNPTDPVPVVSAPIPTQATAPAPAVAHSSTSTKVTRHATAAKSPYAENVAAVHASTNADRANCLRAIVDRKLDYDVRTGVIHDFGNVLTSPVCAAFVYKAGK